MKNYSRLELFYAKGKRLQKCDYLGEMRRFEKWPNWPFCNGHSKSKEFKNSLF